MPWALAGAAIGAAGGIYSSNKASKAQQQSTREASDFQQRQFEQNRADLAPWREAGARGLQTLEDQMPDLTRDFRMTDYTEDPGYQFRLAQGQKSVNANAMARGRFDSGSTLKALTDYNSGAASQEYGNAFNRFRAQQGDRYNRLAGMAGVGQSATNATNADRTGMGNQVAGNMIGGGNAAAAGYIGAGNAINQGIGTGINFWQGQNAINAIRGAGNRGSGTASWNMGYRSPMASYYGEDG